MTTNWRHALRIALPLPFRQSAMVSKSGIGRPVDHISSMLRCASFS